VKLIPTLVLSGFAGALLANIVTLIAVAAYMFWRGRGASREDAATEAAHKVFDFVIPLLVTF
jgi:hypothetical protein